MGEKKSPGADGTARGAGICFSAKSSVPKDSALAFPLQRAVRHLAEHFGLPLATAAVVAELAGLGGAP